jgi:acyl carrier protein
MSASVSQLVERFLLDQFLPGEQPGRLTAATPLLSGGIVDSIGMLRLVAFLETEFDVVFEADDLTAANFDSIAAIERLVREKQARRGA